MYYSFITIQQISILLIFSVRKNEKFVNKNEQIYFPIILERIKTLVVYEADFINNSNK